MTKKQKARSAAINELTKLSSKGWANATPADYRPLERVLSDPPKFYKYAPGDQILDLTFDPPSNGVITGKHEKPDAYFVRIQGGRNDVIIHARNLRRV